MWCEWQVGPGSNMGTGKGSHVQPGASGCSQGDCRSERGWKHQQGNEWVWFPSSSCFSVFNSFQPKVLARVLLWRSSSHSAGRGTGSYCWLLVSCSREPLRNRQAYRQSPHFASVLPAKRNTIVSVKKFIKRWSVCLTQTPSGHLDTKH